MPKGSLTNEQAVVVLIRIVTGIQSEVGVSYRSENYYKNANALSLLDKIPVLNNRKNITIRGDLALLIYTHQLYHRDFKKIENINV
jgi:hypothetical protein